MTGRKKKYHLIDDYHLLAYDELDSTNDEARRLAEGGAAHGAVIWARTQTDGRGRMGREWVSHDGNLFVSVLLAPKVKPEIAPQLSLVSSLAVLETLEPIVSDNGGLRLKWPNDILLFEKKVGGILLESFECESPDSVHQRWVVVGVGINVDNCPEGDDLRFPATCLKEAGVELISPKIVLSRFIHHFIQCYDTWVNEGFDAITGRWKSHAFRLGEEITIVTGNDTVTGTFHDVDNFGQICLKRADGNITCIAAGDVVAQAL